MNAITNMIACINREANFTAYSPPSQYFWPVSVISKLPACSFWCAYYSCSTEDMFEVANATLSSVAASIFIFPNF